MSLILSCKTEKKELSNSNFDETDNDDFFSDSEEPPTMAPQKKSIKEDITFLPKIRKILNERTFDREIFHKKENKELFIKYLENLDKFDLNSVFYGNEIFLNFCFQKLDLGEISLLINNKLSFLLDLNHLHILVKNSNFYPNPYKLYLCEMDSIEEFKNRIFFFKQTVWKGKILTRKPNSLFFQRKDVLQILDQFEIFFVSLRERKIKIEKRIR